MKSLGFVLLMVCVQTAGAQTFPKKQERWSKVVRTAKIKAD